MRLFEKKKKVYLRDTDATDIVYYSRHLEWFEEVRIDFIAKAYKSLTKLIEEDKISFLPISVKIDYKAPAMFEDEVTIRMGIKSVEKLKMELDYIVTKEIAGKEVVVSTAQIIMLCIDIAKGGRPSKIPANVAAVLSEWSTAE